MGSGEETMRKSSLLVLVAACTTLVAFTGLSASAFADHIREPACPSGNPIQILNLNIDTPEGHDALAVSNLTGSGVVCGTAIHDPLFGGTDCDPESDTIYDHVEIKTPPGVAVNSTTSGMIGRYVGNGVTNAVACAGIFSQHVPGATPTFNVDAIGECQRENSSLVGGSHPGDVVACYKGTSTIMGYNAWGWVWVNRTGSSGSYRYNLTLGPMDSTAPGSAGLTKITSFELCDYFGASGGNGCGSSSQPWVQKNGFDSTGTDGCVNSTGLKGLYKATATNFGGVTTPQATACVEWISDNQPPDCNNMPLLNVQSEGRITFSLTCTDPDGDTMWFDKGPVSHGQVNWVNQATGRVEYINNGDGASQDTFTFKAKDPPGSDSWSNTATATITIGPRPPNEPPRCNNMPSLNVQSEGRITFSLTCADLEGDTMWFDKGPVSHGELNWVNQTTGEVEYINNGDGASQDTFTFKAKDPPGSDSWSNTANATITVGGGGELVCTDMSLNGYPGEQIAFDMSEVCTSSSEIDRYEIEFRGDNGCAGSVSYIVAWGSGNVSPNNDCYNPFIFYFRAQDVTGTWSEWATAITIINHVAGNHAPVCQDIELQGGPGDFVPFDVSAPVCTDPDGDALRYELIVLTASCGPIDLNEEAGWGALIPDPGCTRYVFAYQAVDGDGAMSHPALGVVTAGGRDGGSSSEGSGTGSGGGNGARSGDKKKPPNPKGKHGGTKARGMGLRI